MSGGPLSYLYGNSVEDWIDGAAESSMDRVEEYLTERLEDHPLVPEFLAEMRRLRAASDALRRAVNQFHDEKEDVAGALKAIEWDLSGDWGPEVFLRELEIWDKWRETWAKNRAQSAPGEGEL